jgi:hypothetical protein
MALVWIDGFDAYGPNGYVADGILQEAGYYQFQSFNSVPNTQVSSDTRTGVGYSVNVNTWGHWGGGFGRSFNLAGGLIVGFAVKNLQNAYNRILEIGYNNLLGGVFTQITCAYNGANGLTFQTGDGAKAYFTAPNVLFEGVWQYVEIKYVMSGGSPVLQVKIDGVMALNTAGASTSIQNAGQPTLCNFLQFGTDSPSSVMIDDLYICDTSGASFNDFLGDCVVHALLPSGDAGPNQFSQVGGTGAGHFTSVNELTPDGDASYLYSNTPGQYELFSVPTLPTDIVDVLAVGVNVIARKQAAGVGTYEAVVNYGGTEEAGSPLAASLGYVSQQTLFQAPPGGGAWTLTGTQTAKFGVKIV